MPVPIPEHLKDLPRPRINRAPSPVLAMSLPWVLVMLGSLSPTWPIVSSAPVMPPLGFLFLLGWLHLRPGLFPVWAGLPLGFFDDLFSGQPMGSAILLWSLATIGMDYVPLARLRPELARRLGGDRGLPAGCGVVCRSPPSA
jgi:rod shape-determining protein MreD